MIDGSKATGGSTMGRNGTGVVLRGSSIQVNFSHEGINYRKRVVVNGLALTPSPANIKYAQRLVNEIREKVRHGTFVMSDYFQVSGNVGALTLATQMETWLNAQRIEASTKAGYQAAINFWTPIDKPIRLLKKSDILTQIAQHPHLSGKTLNNYVSVLREALQLAVEDKAIPENVAATVPRAKWQKPPVDPFSREESDAIIARMQDRFPGQVANLVEFVFWTGLRTSEWMQLQWSQVDLASGSILVDQAKVRGNVKQTKTNTARTVRLNSRALAAITRQKAHTLLAGKEVWQDPRYLSAWVDERAFRRSYWLPTLKALGIRYRRPYNCRHSYATAMLMAGIAPPFAAKQMGHSVEMFLRVYSKWLDGAQSDDEMAKVESAIGANFQTKQGQA